MDVLGTEITHLEKSQKQCFKRCLNDFTKPYFSPAETTCLYRCANKFSEAIEFTRNQI